MRRALCLIFGSWWGMLAVTGSAVAQSAALEEAFEAHGADRITEAQTLEFRVRVVDTWVNQGRRPVPPWDSSSGYHWHAVDFVNERYGRQSHTLNAGFYSFYNRRIVDGENGRLINLMEKYWYPAPGGQGAFANQTLEGKQLLAPWLVADALANGGAEDRGEVTQDGRSMDKVRATLSGGTEATLYFDTETNLLVRMERSGEPAVRVYSGYEKRDGMLVNTQTGVIYRGDPVLDLHLIALGLDADVEFMFRMPDGIDRLDYERDPEARAFKVQKLDPGIWFVGEGVFYQLFVEFDDFVVAVGGIEGAEKRIRAIAEKTGGKPLRYAVITHHHSDHLVGAPALARAGATLIVADGNEAATREALAGTAGEIETVADRRTITDGVRSLDLYQIGPGAHADAMLAAHLPAEKILYTGDLLVQPPGRPMRARIPPIRDLVIAIETFGLAVERHLDPHSPRITSLAEIYKAFHN